MLSSTVKELLPDRIAVKNTLQSTGIVKFIGVAPIDTFPQNESPYISTMRMAEECDLYILLLGGKYGYVTNHNKSATELEFDAAYRNDPTKILIFKKQVKRLEHSQSTFINKVTDYHKGYFISKFNSLPSLESQIRTSFEQWLTDRTALGKKLNYFDHFIRIAIQRLPFPNVHPTYCVEENHLELSYKISGRKLSIHFEKSHIYNDFWGSVSVLDNQFEKWRLNMYEKS